MDETDAAALPYVNLGSSGAGHNLVNEEGTVTPEQGPLINNGKCISVGPGYVYRVSSYQYNLGNNVYCVEAWIYPTDVSGDRCIMSHGNFYKNPNQGWGVLVVGGKLEFRTVTSSTWQNVLTTGVYIEANKRYHVVFVISLLGNFIAFYVNGIFVESVVYNGNSNTGTDHLGIDGWRGGSPTPDVIGYPFYGKIDEVAFYREMELTPSQILQHYNAGR